jgi:undecaprenyl-diphosphatase
MGDQATLRVREAIALGLLQGPTELVPVSSSAHTTLAPWLLRWRCARLAPERRRAFEVALHAGTAAALLGTLRLPASPHEATVMLLAIAPPAAAGYALEGTIDRRWSDPRTIAFGLLAGSAAMALGEALARRRGARGELGLTDGALLGAAQAVALVPGVSRNGATLAVARARGFAPEQAEQLSWHVALPVIAGASALKLGRSLGRSRPEGGSGAIVAGACSAYASTALCARLLTRRPRSRAGPRLIAYAAYRSALAAAVLLRLRTSAVRRAGACGRDGDAPGRACKDDRRAPGSRSPRLRSASRRRSWG